jgi:hypothetical protein
MLPIPPVQNYACYIDQAQYSNNNNNNNNNNNKYFFLEQP